MAGPVIPQQTSLSPQLEALLHSLMLPGAMAGKRAPRVPGPTPPAPGPMLGPEVQKALPPWNPPLPRLSAGPSLGPTPGVPPIPLGPSSAPPPAPAAAGASLPGGGPPSPKDLMKASAITSAVTGGALGAGAAVPALGPSLGPIGALGAFMRRATSSSSPAPAPIDVPPAQQPFTPTDTSPPPGKTAVRPFASHAPAEPTSPDLSSLTSRANALARETQSLFSAPKAPADARLTRHTGDVTSRVFPSDSVPDERLGNSGSILRGTRPVGRRTPSPIQYGDAIVDDPASLALADPPDQEIEPAGAGFSHLEPSTSALGSDDFTPSRDPVQRKALLKRLFGLG